MKHLIIAVIFGAAALPAETINFEADAAGALPSGWSSAMTHDGGAPRWEVVQDSSAPSKPNALAQLSSDRTSRRFPLAVYDKTTCKDGELSVRFKAISGDVDASGGLVWRYRDENNYYVVRSNALENNTVLYKLENGRRSSLAPKDTPPKTYGVKHTVAGQTWHTLRVTFQGPLFTVYFNGKKLFEVEDATFTEAGKTGLWTKADAVTRFDDFQVTPR
ncbi:MAG: DUF1080 domain-containing protein [bacterium]|nr:DUF1080 domain-containing protein [bacterium]